jgi:Leucine-rich repeat (LRR) protein
MPLSAEFAQALGSGDTDRLRALLCHPRRELRQLAARALSSVRHGGDPGQEGICHEAVTLLESATVAERVRGAEWLQGITTPDLVSDRDERRIDFAIPALAAAACDASARVACAALAALRAAMAEDDISDALPTALHLLSGKRPNTVRRQAALLLRDSLVSRGTDLSGAIPELAVLLGDRDAKVKWAAADLLSYHHASRQAWPEVERLLTHPDKDVRQEAAGTLGQLSGAKLLEAVPLLLRRLTDPREHPEVKLVAARTLSQAAGSEADLAPAVPVVAKMMSDRVRANRKHAVATARMMVSRLRELEGSSPFSSKQRPPGDETFARWRVLAPLEGPLRGALKSRASGLRQAAAGCLALLCLRLGRAGELLALLDRPDELVREAIGKSVQDDPWPVPAELRERLEAHEGSRLAEILRQEARKAKKEVSLSGQPLGSRKLVVLPPEIGLLSSAEKLDLSGNRLTSLPAEIGRLHRLRSLVLSNNRLGSLPSEIGQLESLKSLFLYRNRLTRLPDTFGKLRQLSYLQLIENLLTELPGSFCDLEQLEILDAHDNQLRNLPSGFGRLFRLASLNLANNRLTELPDDLDRLAALASLDLSRNRLSVLPGPVFQLPSLSSLSAGFADLERLPPEVGALTRLKTLELRKNALRHLPAELGKLSGLEVLDVSHNRLRSLPEELLGLKRLRWLDVRDNPLPAAATRCWPSRPGEILSALFGKK